ncbi:MAG: hypothetical protein ACRDMV_19495 [Streptosporangiales bacterium]
MSRALTWISVVLLVAIAGGGVWLIVAPHVVGYQPHGADWTLATRDDLIAGAVVLGVSLLTLGGYFAASLRARVRREP